MLERADYKDHLSRCYLDNGLPGVEAGHVDHAKAVHVRGRAVAGLVLHLRR